MVVLPNLSTHPATKERIADVKGFINSHNIRIIQNKQRIDTWNELRKTFKE